MDDETLPGITLRFVGDEPALARAREEIERFRARRTEAEASGRARFGLGPEDVPGGFQWSFGMDMDYSVDEYDGGGHSDLLDDLFQSDQPLRLLIYSYSEGTEGDLWSSLSVFDCFDKDSPANNRGDEFEDVALGIDAAIALDRCEEDEADEADLAHLRARFAFALARSRGGEPEWLPTAGACLQALWLALRNMPEDSPAWGPTEALEEDIRRARLALGDFFGKRKKGLQRDVDTLLAEIGRRKIQRAAAPSGGAEGSDEAGAGNASSGKGVKGKKAGGKETKASGPTTL